LEQQLLNQKWLIEHAVDDRVIDDTAISVAPDLSTLRGGYFDVGVRRFNDGTLSAEPILHRVEDIEALQVPDVSGGPYGKRIAWYRAMKEMAQAYHVTLNGQPLEVKVTIGAGGGPIPDAYALAGQNLFLWMAEDPDRVHRLMGLLADAFIAYQRHVRDLRGDPHQHLSMGCDAGEMLSAEMFAEFVVPYYLRCYDAFPGNRGLHMCGRIDHLVPTIAERLEITHLNGFGFSTDPELLVEWMGGKVVMSGGLSPVLLLEGPTEAIKQASFRYLKTFADCGGYILQDGNNVAPGTPLQHLAAVVDAAKAFGGRRP
jgi:uroporphyrinogen-III decarboxylase